MDDPTVAIRRQLQAEINGNAGSRRTLEARYGRVWDDREFNRDFEVVGFAAPLVVVRRRADGVRGSLTFQHAPRFYFDFETG